MATKKAKTDPVAQARAETILKDDLDATETELVAAQRRIEELEMALDSTRTPLGLAECIHSVVLASFDHQFGRLHSMFSKAAHAVAIRVEATGVNRPDGLKPGGKAKLEEQAKTLLDQINEAARLLQKDWPKPHITEEENASGH